MRGEGGGIVVDTGTQPIHYMNRQDYLRRYPGITPVRPVDHPALLSIRVENLAACEALLKKNGVKVSQPELGPAARAAFRGSRSHAGIQGELIG